MSEITADMIPWHKDTNGLINLGPNNGGAIGRLACYATALLKTRKEIPDGSFTKWAAGRLCGEDKQDLVLFLAGRRGSGKSYSSLWIAVRTAKQIAKLKGGKWTDYFRMENIATLENTQKVLEILKNAGMHQVVIIDDASLAINNRNWASAPSKNFVALLTICRTRRWFLILTAPLKKMADNQVRDMVDLTATVYKPHHCDINGRGGFNIIKLVSGDISTAGKEYSKKLHFEKKKIDFWVTFRPDLDIIEAYDKQRNEGAERVHENILENGTYLNTGEKKPVGSLAERNTTDFISEHGKELTETIAKNPYISVNELAARTMSNQQTVKRAMIVLGLELKKKPRMSDPVTKRVPKPKIAEKIVEKLSEAPDGSSQA